MWKKKKFSCQKNHIHTVAYIHHIINHGFPQTPFAIYWPIFTIIISYVFPQTPVATNLYLLYTLPGPMDINVLMYTEYNDGNIDSCKTWKDRCNTCSNYSCVRRLSSRGCSSCTCLPIILLSNSSDLPTNKVIIFSTQNK